MSIGPQAAPLRMTRALEWVRGFPLMLRNEWGTRFVVRES